MIFLFTERIDSRSTSLGNRHCSVCGKERNFSKVEETNYFCLFGLRLLPLEKIANYERCDQCNNTFSPGHPFEPAHVAQVRQVLCYIQLGHGMQEYVDLVQDICIKVAGADCPLEQIERISRNLVTGELDVLAALRKQSCYFNVQGKHQVIEAAFLMTHACCEIQYEDRLRIDRLGSAMGVSVEFVHSVIEHVRARGCYGVRRILPTQTKAT